MASSEPQSGSCRADDSPPTREEAAGPGVEYFHRVSPITRPRQVRVRPVDRRSLRWRSPSKSPSTARPGAARTTPWFAVPATACRRCRCSHAAASPSRAPAAVWLFAAGALVRRRGLVVFPISLVRRRDGGRVPAREPAQRAARLGIGLGVVIAGAATVVYNKPGHSAGEISSPASVRGQLAGRLRDRESSEQAEEAERRATPAEREREAAARIAVAEERARIARELSTCVS